MASESEIPKGESSHPFVNPLREVVQNKLQSGKLDLPVLPEAASKVVTLSYDENCDISQLAAVIKRDQALSANVLRISNTPIYSAGTQIKTLDHAVSRLGMKKVRDIALIISCESRVFQVPGFEKEVRLLFKHSLASAGFAEAIARLRRLNIEESFLAGLLHDIGKPLLYQTISDLQKERGAAYPIEAVQIVVQEFHQNLGSEMVKKWALPERLVETIAYHHNPMEAPTCSQQAQLTSLASDFSHHLVGPLEISEETLRDHPMLGPLNLYEEEVEALFKQKEKVLELVQAVS